MTDDLQTWKWLLTEQGQEAIAQMPASMTPALIASFRKKMSAEQLRVASETSRARVKAARKLDPEFCASLIADIPAVEMATSGVTSKYKAKRFVSVLGTHGMIADLCSGIGGDSWGLKQAGLKTIGIDSSHVRSWMYEHNTECDSICGDAVDDCPTDIMAFHLDPARRISGGTRTLELEDYLPNPDAWNRLLEQHPTGAIKLNPGVDAQLLPQGEVEIVSESGQLTQAVLWLGKLAGPHLSRATLLEKNGLVCSIVGEPNRPEDSNKIEEFLGTLDPSLERADLVNELLELTKYKLVHPGTGMITCNQYQLHPMIRWHEVLEIMSWNRKKVKASLRALNAGIVEVRTRAGVVNPDIEQKQLRGKGCDSQITVFIYRIDTRIHAIITRRVDKKENPCSEKTARVEGEVG
ncbi:MAG: hypothetical protein P1U42_08630 [Phycisphaerales bacterium]|nr:hypothetical protein [Phycisphaerales bacterium]